jgi:hypothetical protein
MSRLLSFSQTKLLVAGLSYTLALGVPATMAAGMKLATHDVTRI